MKMPKFFKSIFRSYENPSQPITGDLLSYGIATTGEDITLRRALGSSPFWRAVNLLAGDIARTPMIVYRRNGKNMDIDPQHQAYHLLRYKPNASMTAVIFKETIAAHMLHHGNGYAWIRRDGMMRPIELILLSPESTFPMRANGEMLYVVKLPDGTMSRVRPDEILHFKGLGFDGLTGYKVIEYMRDVVALGLAAHKYSATVFKNSGRPSVLLEFPGIMDENQQKSIREQWDRMHSGIDNQHRTAILEKGLKANPMPGNAKDAQLIEALKWNVIDVANIFGIPPHKLGDSSRTAYNSLESENRAYLDEALDKLFIKFEEECRDKLFTEEEKITESHAVLFDRARLVQPDAATKANYNRAALSGLPWMTLNEVRASENMNAVEGGDEIKAPSNNFAQTTPQTAQPTGTVDGKDPVSTVPTRAWDRAKIETAINDLKTEAEGRAMSRLCIQAEKHAKQGAKPLAEFLARLELDHAPAIDGMTTGYRGLCDAVEMAKEDVSGRLFTQFRMVLGKFLTAETIDFEAVKTELTALKGAKA